jgi:hypothetical protein
MPIRTAAWQPKVRRRSRTPTGLTFFSNNDDFLGGKTLEQDPLSSTQLHLTYDLGRGLWVALSATYDYGGTTTTGGVRNDDFQNNWRGGATLSLPVNRNNSIKLFAQTGIQIITGTDIRLVGFIWQYRWGQGL